MSKLYLLGMGLFSMGSYYVMAKSYNVKLKYDPKELLYKHAGVDTDALIQASTEKLNQQKDQLTDHVVAQVEKHTEWIGTELEKVPTMLSIEADKFSNEVANLFK